MVRPLLFCGVLFYIIIFVVRVIISTLMVPIRRCYHRLSQCHAHCCDYFSTLVVGPNHCFYEPHFFVYAVVSVFNFVFIVITVCLVVIDFVLFFSILSSFSHDPYFFLLSVFSTLSTLPLLLSLKSYGSFLLFVIC